MKIVLIGDADDVRGALLAGASFCRTREEASADPEVGLIVEPEKGDDDATAGQPGRGVRRGA